MTTRLVDCRFVLGEPGRGRELYRAGHVPGAVHLDLDRDLSDLSVEGAGRHPLPAAGRFAETASRAGIGPDTLVLAYDDGMSGGAARLWWLLRHFGHERCGVLDGGLRTWLGPLAAGDEAAPPARFEARERDDDVATADELLARLRDPALVVVDARAPERYRGEVEPLDPVAGRIPGAVNLPHASSAELPETLLAAPELVVYCGSGVTACVDLLRLHRAGRTDARLYPGSWSEWSRRGLPVERTPE